ncbi:MAG TPA: serine protease [Caulobacteraceae bacterium]|nr:serine protease [Caulobacteraceae bacterium]
MPVDLSVDMIKATVQLEQPLGDGARTVGTGFLLNVSDASGRPRTILVTAAHVLHKMPAGEARIGYRFQTADGAWRYAPQPLTIRKTGGAPAWVQHPHRDVAALEIAAPPEFARSAIPLNWLAGDETFTRIGLGPGDEMMALGFPLGLSANQAGFPILRAGKVASYPLAPSAEFPTFLLDFNVFPGNSGGPIYVAGEGQGFVAGMLTQQVELTGERLDIGIVTHARYVRETVEMLDGRSPPGMSFAHATPGAVAASAMGQAR